MRNFKSFPLLWLLISSFAFGQGKQPANAIIEVLADSAAGQILYLTRFRGPALDYEYVDSAKANAGHRFSFTVNPDPNKEYRLQLGSKLIQYGIFLAPDDSLVFHYRADRGDTLIFDRVGANTAFHDPSVQPQSQWDFYHDMGDREWTDMCSYLVEFRKKMEKTAEHLRSLYPDHPGVSNEVYSAAIRWYYEPILRDLTHDFFDTTGNPLAVYPARFRIPDSIPWTLEALANSNEVWYLASNWLEFVELRWWREGVDTAGHNYESKVFEFARSLPSPARKAAWLDAARSVAYGRPTEVVPLMERELQLHGAEMDTPYTAAFERKLSVLRKKLPGKPAPSFSLPDSSGKLISLSDFRGKIIYLDFWGTWCHPCLEELPALAELEKKLEGNSNVAFVSIAMEYERWDYWKNFVRVKALHGTQLYAEKQFRNETAEAYDIQGAPTFMLIGRDGTFIDAAAPRPSSGKAEEAIRAALSQKND